MAMNVGSRPEQLLRGVDRLVAVAADVVPRIPALPRRHGHIPARWLIERGTTRVQAPVNVFGGFPGSLRSMNRLDNVRLVATMRYLVVGEGTAHGFAIPIRDVLATALARPGRRSNHGLRVWYRDGDQTAMFFLDCRGISRSISGLTRAGQILQFLVERGVTPVEGGDAPRHPSLHMSWDDAGRYTREELVWAGNGVAAVGGWFGTRHDHCRMWVTEQSLLWAGAHQEGVNRIALSDILQARDGAGDRLCIGIANGLGYRFDLSFDLAGDHVGMQRRANPRVQFMNALATLGVPVATATTPLAPWRAGSMVRPSDRSSPQGPSRP